jgi:hypothetical protein
MRFRRGAYCVTFILCAFPASGSQANAQALTGSIAGRAVDPQGAAVPGTKIIVRNTDIASARTLTSDAEGAFRATGLVPGAYTVEGRAGKLASRRPVRLTVTLGSSTGSSYASTSQR